MTNNLMAERRAAVRALVIIALPLLISTSIRAQEVFSARMIQSGKIEAEVSEPPLNAAGDDPVVQLYEVVQVGDIKKSFERRPLNITTGITASPQRHFIATLTIPPQVAGFDHYEVEVRNYKTSAGTETFRSAVFGLTAEITKASGREIDLMLRGLNTTDWNKVRTWMSFAAAAGPDVTVTKNGVVSTLKVTHASVIRFAPICPPLKLGESFSICLLPVTLALNGRLPVGQPVNVKLTIPLSVLPPNPIASGLALELIGGGIKPVDVNTKAETAVKDRDPVRINVLEVGGSYNTSIKLDPDPATNKAPERKTDGTLDLRLASPTITFADNIDNWWTWTPAQLDVLVSTGKLSGDSLSTNTMRLFTQVQGIKATDSKYGLNFYRLVGEGGVTADRDLRVIEYTGIGDFRYNPAFLNRVLDRDPPPDLAKIIRVELIPFGVELGHRQVRRDPFFIADDFVRRFRFAGKLELVLPPYFQFSVENRSWWRGEVAQNKFKNYFTTSLTFFPARLSTNSSAGVFVSYERGSLPPFTTQRISTFKLGVRVRRKNW